MRFIVTFGPTYEPLDQVRRLTNFSTGRLGTEFSNFLVREGHEVIALRGHYCTCTSALAASMVREFTTTEHLLARLHECAGGGVQAVFHAAAVSDFKFGTVFERTASGLAPLSSGKFSTRASGLMVELVPTIKIISRLREMFPQAHLTGWKYEVDGNRETTLAAAVKQIRENRTDYCVANGPAYGEGFGIQSADRFIEHCETPERLFPALLRLVERSRPQTNSG